jgi:hypothetical protein
VNPTTNTIYAYDYLNIAVIDGTTDQVTSTIMIQDPSDFVVDPVHDKLYALSNGALLVADGATNMVTANYKISYLGVSPTYGNHHLAVDFMSQTVMVVGQDKNLANTIITLDGTTGNVLSTTSPASFPAAVVALGNGLFGVLYPDPSLGIFDSLANALEILLFGDVTATCLAASGRGMFVYGYDSHGGSRGFAVGDLGHVGSPPLHSLDPIVTGYKTPPFLIVGGVLNFGFGPMGREVALTLQADPSSPGTTPPASAFNFEVTGITGQPMQPCAKDSDCASYYCDMSRSLCY